MNTQPLHLRFDQPALDPALRWHCEPARWQIDADTSRLVLHPGAKTDFWQRTHYGFEVDNGHFLHLQASGDFVLTTQVSSSPVHQYDQAGLMLRISPSCWLKTSVEFEPGGPSRLGAVVTNAQYSDWSTQSIPADGRSVWFRLRAESEDCIVESSFDGSDWQQLRIAHLMERSAVQSVACGLYACSPQGAGYRAEFHFLDFKPGRLAG